MTDLYKNLLVLDIETTGTNPFRNDAIALALVPLDRSLPELEVYVSHTELRWNDFARQNFTNFERHWATKAIPADLACTKVEEYIEGLFGGQDAILIGHNIGFDVAFLRKLAAQGGRDQLRNISHRALDTHTLLYLLALQGRVPSSALSSDGAFRHFGIGANAEQRHTALYDARTTRELFEKIIAMLVPQNSTLDVDSFRAPFAKVK